LVLSSESIFPEFIEKLGWLFRKHNLEVIILFVLRDSIDRAASYYNQQVKDPAIGLKQLPDIFLKNSAELFRLRPIIESFKSLEYKLVYIRYKASEPIIKRFCDILGTKYNAQYEQTVNRSMNSKGLLTMLIVNLITNSESKRRQILNNMLTDSSYEIWKGAAFPFSKNSCKQFSEFLEEDYAWVLDNTGILLTPSNFQKFTINTKEKFEIVSKLLVYKVLNKSNSKQIESLLENFL
jgi:hypothetical protein